MAWIAERTTSKGEKRWDVCWREGGRPRKKTCRTASAAKQLYKRVSYRVDVFGQYEEAPKPARRVPTLWELTEQYLDEGEVRGWQPATLRRKTTFTGVFLRWLHERVGADPVCEDLSRTILVEYTRWLEKPQSGRHGHGRSEATVVRMGHEVEQLWKWMWDRGEEEGYECPRPRRLELPCDAPPERPPPSWEEMDAVVRAAASWPFNRVRQEAVGWRTHPWYGVVVIQRYTGLRLKQVMGLRWEHLDFDRRLLTIVPELGKSRQERRGRVIPVSTHLLEELQQWSRPEDHLVPTWTRRKGERHASSSEARKLWTAAGVRPEVWHRRPTHAFRAGLQSGLKALGADDEAVQELVGHSRGTRARYVPGAVLPTRAAVDLIPAIDLGGLVVRCAA